MRSRAAAICLLAVLFPLAACSGYGQPNQAAAQLAFGVDMARRGLWNEALFRFQEAEKLDPSNPRIQSNMGVAYEASGQFDKALESYKKALNLAPNDKEIRANYGRFVEFYQGFKGEKTATGDGKAGPAKPPGTGAPTPPPPGAAPAPATPPIDEPPSTPEDVPPPPADNRPPR
ncbi:MAG TPA: tetratricopeptide repeat protein [Thermoanaerobaculia bacterium]|jgi:tetratricopeptide (TPR) repeat protein|nr:tetratricopeptide repeat protein [Thermoanaerobaculia bacterium]